MNYPLVTVIICTYNGERYLSQTLDSVLKQTYPNIEIVIVDDGSSDNTVSIISQYADHDQRIRWFVKENSGLPSSRNFAFSQANGEWIAIIDQDDLCYPDRLKRQIEVAAANPSASLVFCNTDYINKDNKIIGNHLSKFSLPDAFIPKKVAANLLLCQGCYVDSEALFFKRNVINQFYPLDETLRYACDYEYFIRLGFEIDFAYTTDTLSAWRIHEKQLSTTDFNRFKEIREVLMRFFFHDKLTIYTRFVIIQKFVRMLASEAYHIVQYRFNNHFNKSS